MTNIDPWNRKYPKRDARPPEPDSPHYPFFVALNEGRPVWRDDTLNHIQEWLTLNHPGIQGNAANVTYFGWMDLRIVPQISFETFCNYYIPAEPDDIIKENYCYDYDTFGGYNPNMVISPSYVGKRVGDLPDGRFICKPRADYEI